jgi:hypothetical protein
MSMGVTRLRCICGHIIYDDAVPADILPYKAYFLPDEDEHPALDLLAKEVAAFIDARERGEQEQYVQELEPLPDKSSLKDILVHAFWYPVFELGYGRAMYECEECGRLWMHTSPHRAE